MSAYQQSPCCLCFSQHLRMCTHLLLVLVLVLLEHLSSGGRQQGGRLCNDGGLCSTQEAVSRRVCVCMHENVCVLCVCLRGRTCQPAASVCVCAKVYMYTNTHTHRYTHIYTTCENGPLCSDHCTQHTRTHAHTYSRTHTHTHTHITCENGPLHCGH